MERTYKPMQLTSLLVKLLTLHKTIDVTAEQHFRIIRDQEIAQSKPEFLDIVRDMQTCMIEASGFRYNPEGCYLEIGAGVLPLKLNYPSIISTDIVKSPYLDGVLDATSMNLMSESLDGLFLQNTFHHISNPDSFFKECVRVLKPKGTVVIVDPFFNLLSSLIYPNLFSTETFDKKGIWEKNSKHSMIGANQALSFIVFERDFKSFQSRYKSLIIEKKEPLPQGLRYLLSGGLNFRKLVPFFVFRLLRHLETRNRIPSFLSIHWMIVLRKI